jgi:hypothetical protein
VNQDFSIGANGSFALGLFAWIPRLCVIPGIVRLPAPVLDPQPVCRSSRGETRRWVDGDAVLSKQ